MKYEVKLG